MLTIVYLQNKNHKRESHHYFNFNTLEVMFFFSPHKSLLSQEYINIWNAKALRSCRPIIRVEVWTN